MLLAKKVAVIYGAGGAVGGAVANAFAREGASVFLAGRTLEKVEAAAEEIRSQGGTAEAAEVDALDKKSVENYLAGVVKKAGRLDISFNAIGLGDAQGVPLLEMTTDHFLLPIEAAMRTQFVTGTAAAKHMAKNKAGVILAIAAQAGGGTLP